MSSEAAGPGEVRIGTREREDAIKVLGEHLAAGRLEMDEYEERVGRATAARTLTDLRPLFADLPPPHPPALAPPPPPMPPPAPPRMVPPPVGYPHPAAMLPPSDRSKVAAGLLQILLPFGVGRFYTGHAGIAIAQLLTTFLCGAGVVWSIVDGVVLLINGGTDAQGRQLRD
ncbi:DUF1707 domain-containing protein [Longimycelium tulufanense]|uniref:DUF1707 domain-containing protein n=1 Tax=Longimycelium tulufanense TaxID=907463 RepID=UPI00166E0D4C|nr:DUF1707 domain-containing protein [Longimycelium tulufanense]